MDSTLDLSQFEIIKRVGKGGFGEVFKVKEKKTDQIFAAKVSLLSFSEASEVIIQSFSREVNIIAKLNNPSIVKFIGYSPTDFNKDPKPVIITEFLSNGSLEDILNLEREGLCKDNWDDTRKLINIYGIAKAMSYLHAHNIIHRDLKPANILMDDYLLPRITDFGISKIDNPKDIKLQSKATTTVKGTPIYIAPEIWTSYEYTNAGDVYAFAIIVYEIMTNEKPYKNCNSIDLAIKVMNNIRPKILGIPESYQNLIERCWDQEPSNRPSFNEIVEELKTNPEFITDMVELVDYEDYIDFIDNCEISFDENKSINIIDFEKKFKKVIIDKSLLNNINDDDSNEEEEDNEDSKLSNETENIDETTNTTEIKNKLPFTLPPCDPATEKYRKMFIDKVYTSPKEEIPNILYSYAVLSYTGKYLPKNTKEAGIFYKIAADMGHIESMIHYAVYLYGENSKANMKEAKRYTKMAIEKGSSAAMFSYGLLLEDEKDVENAIKYYEMAAEKGEMKAINRLFTLYYKGIGVEKDQRKAFHYCKIGADKGNSESLFFLGTLYFEGFGVEKDYDKSFNCYQKAANQGYVLAMITVSTFYIQGIGTPVNLKEAVKYFKKAADLGHPNGMALYASALYNGKGIKSNKTEAIKYFKMSIETGNKNALRLYGLALIEDDKNSVEGFNYLKLAAEKGDITAMEKIGDLLFDKQNATENDYDESFNYYKMAYLKNPTKNCMSHIRSLIQRGLISANNIDDRTSFIKVSADKNDKEAMMAWFFLKQNRKYCESSQNNLQEGAFYLKKAADLGDADAMIEYSRFLTAQDEERNQEEAHRYMQMASILGNRDTRNINNDSSNKPVNQTTTTTNNNNNNKSMQKQNNYINRSTSNNNNGNKNLTNQTSNRSLIDDDDELSISSDEANQMDRKVQPKNQSSTSGCKKIKLSKCAIAVITFVGTLALILIIYFAVH